MKPVLIAILGATIIGAMLKAETRSSQKEVNNSMLKAVIHINFDDSDRQESALGNIENIFKEVPAAEIEVVCHGKGVSLLEKAKSPHADQVRKLIEQGARFAACENTMKKHSLSKNDLLPAVVTVPSGAVAIIQKQQEGYSYFRP